MPTLPIFLWLRTTQNIVMLIFLYKDGNSVNTRLHDMMVRKLTFIVTYVRRVFI